MTKCASPAEVLLCAITGSISGDTGELPDHVRDCGACREQLAELKARITSTTALPAEHLDDFALAGVVGATRASDLDDANIAHLAHCEQCRRTLSEIVELVRDPFVRAELDRDRPLSIVDGGVRESPQVSRRRSRIRPALVAAAGLAAAAALVLTVRRYSLHPAGAEPSTAIRHATIDVARAPRLVSPLGAVGSVGEMIWTSVPRADRYRVTVFDARGQVVWETEVSDTVATPPAGVLGRYAGELRWRVKARTSFDRWIDSDFAEFSLGGDR